MERTGICPEPACGKRVPVVSGAVGTWVHCPEGHRNHLDSRLAQRARLRLMGGVRDRETRAHWTPQQQTDYRDQMATYRDAARAAYAEVLDEAGVR